jgi:hypothetical protein
MNISGSGTPWIPVPFQGLLTERLGLGALVKIDRSEEGPTTGGPSTRVAAKTKQRPSGDAAAESEP